MGASGPAFESRRQTQLLEVDSMTVVRYVVAAALVVVGLVWIGQGLGYIGGSGMSGQPIFAVIGAVLVVAGAALAWTTRRSASRT
jgi:hypothetical protein